MSESSFDILAYRFPMLVPMPTPKPKSVVLKEQAERLTTKFEESGAIE